jgi:hypothetical protein
MMGARIASEYRAFLLSSTIERSTLMVLLQSRDHFTFALLSWVMWVGRCKFVLLYTKKVSNFQFVGVCVKKVGGGITRV